MPSDGVTLGMPDDCMCEFLKDEFQVYCTIYPNAAWVEVRGHRKLDGSHHSHILIIGDKGETVFKYTTEKQ